ncbi:MAG: THUMP domain-containing protein [Bacteroidales bacterium]
MIAKTFQGLEDVLAQEIIALGGEEVEIGKRMVSFIGDKEMMYKANLHLRTALRILKPIATFMASNTDEVYDRIKSIKWEDYIKPEQTFSIDSVVFSDNFRHSKFVTYRAKDAIADYFQEKTGKRPSVRLTNADLALNLHIAAHTCTLSLDSSGESLHKRGYRVEQTEAPLNEVLAAGMILKTGWRGEKNFVDPMCGSGTLLIEAAMIATNTPAGIYRQGFGFEKWADYDEELFDKLYNDESNEKEFEHKIYGSDISPKAIKIAEENLKSAGLSRYVTLKTLPFQQYTQAPENAILVMNPPYGERISSKDILSLYEMIGTGLKHVFKGYDAWILSYREECFEKIGLKPSEKFDLMNGGLDCQFRKYEIFEGKLKDFKSEGGEFKKERLELDLEGETRTKKELRKERFTGEKKSVGAANRDRRPASAGNRGDRKSFGSGPRSTGARRDNGFERREGGFERRDGERREGGFRPRVEGERREGGFRPRVEGERREGGFARREGSSSRRESTFKKFDRPERGERREGDFEERPRRTYDKSGNFRRNAEGKLELREDGVFKPRGERTFNPNRKMYIPGREENPSKENRSAEKNED